MIAILIELVANPCFEVDRSIYIICEQAQQQQSIKTTAAFWTTTGESPKIISPDNPTFLCRTSWSSIDDPEYRYVPP